MKFIEAGMKFIDIVMALVLILGGLNWGLLGLLDVNLVSVLSSHEPFVTRLIYIIFGLAALYQILQWKNIRLRWIRP